MRLGSQLPSLRPGGELADSSWAANVRAVLVGRGVVVDPGDGCLSSKLK